MKIFTENLEKEMNGIEYRISCILELYYYISHGCACEPWAFPIHNPPVFILLYQMICSV